MNLFVASAYLTILQLCMQVPVVHSEDGAESCIADGTANDDRQFQNPSNIPPWEEMALTSHHLNECNLNPLSLHSDLERYPSISLGDVDRSEDLYGENGRRLVIKNNVLYGRDGSTGAVVGVGKLIEDMLLKILESVKVPDVDFLLNCSDFPMVFRADQKFAQPDAPVVSMCGSKLHNDIIVPTYALALAVAGRRKSGEAARIPWGERKNRLVWRGSDSNSARFTFNLLANSKHFLANKVTDVGINKMIRRPHDPKKHGPLKETIPEQEFGDYKWIANIDGSVAAYRMPFVAALGSVIVWQESHYLEHWYRDLVPWHHYVPMAKDFSDLDIILEWLQTHDTKAQQIGQAARQFALDNLQPSHVECFWYVFLYEYAARMKYKPRVLEGMVKSVL